MGVTSRRRLLVEAVLKQLGACKREFRGRFSSQHFHGEDHGNHPHCECAKIAEELAGPPLKPSLERLQNSTERLVLRTGVLRRSVFCLFGPLFKFQTTARLHPWQTRARTTSSAPGFRTTHAHQPCNSSKNGSNSNSKNSTNKRSRSSRTRLYILSEIFLSPRNSQLHGKVVFSEAFVRRK